MQSDEDSVSAEASESGTGKSNGNRTDDFSDEHHSKKKFLNLKADPLDDKHDPPCDDEDPDDANYSAGGKKDTGKAPGGKTGKKKKKHGGHTGAHHKAFRNTKGHELFTRASPLPEDFEEEEVITHVVGKKPLLGKVWRDKQRGDYSRYRCYNHGIEYKPGEAVYIESQRPDQPYYICCIQDLKMSKRDTLMVHIKWFYRTNEVPEQVYQLLIQDRTTEHNNFNRLQAKRRRNGELEEELNPPVQIGVGSASSTSSTATPMITAKPKSKRLDERMLRMRELFISDATDVYPVSVLRGKCTVHHCQDIKAVKEFEPIKDTFFYTLSYNPETRRLASTQGEIRVGASHQANLPEFLPDVPIEERQKACHYGEEMMWEPSRIHDHDLLMFLRAARSMTAFAAMCDGGSPEDGFTAASRDGITANAIQVLHECQYNTGKALQMLLKCPYPASADVIRTLWPEDDVKDFIKGLRTYGKNFFKIRVEFLPERETSELIEFYYFWKKTPGAANNRPRGRRHRPNVLRRIKPGKTAVVTGPGNGIVKEKEFKMKRDDDDPSSMSEAEESNGEEGEPSQYYCRHCFTTDSKDWHHAGKEKILVCSECRIYFKCYGEFPCLEPPGQRSPTPDPVSNDEELDFEEDEIEDPEDEMKPLDGPSNAAKLLGGELNLTAIERDSDLQGDNPDIDEMELNESRNSIANMSGPVEIKAELPASKTLGLVSPVPTMATPPHQQQLQSPSKLSQQQLPPSSVQQQYRRQLGGPHTQPSGPQIPPASSPLITPGGHPSHHPLSLAANNDVQVLAENFSIQHHQLHAPGYQSLQQQQHQHQQLQQQQQQQQQQPQQQQQQQHQQQQQLQQQPMSPSARSNPSPQLPPTPREPTPPPKPDATECHRSQSAIFTRNWNRGEGNSCARTDLYFKPVPDSKLARKREERLRKATAEREQDALKAAISAAQASDAKMARMEMASHHQPGLPPPPQHGPPSHLFGDPFAQHAAALASLGFSAHQSSQSPMGAAQAMERLERERREQEMRVSMALAMSIAASPLTVTSSMRSPLGHGNPYGPPPGFTAHQANILAVAAAEGRRLEEFAALSRERQYAALATDPLVRLQMAGVNPELPSVHHPSYGMLGPPPGLGPPGGGVPRGPQTPGPGSYDSRFRSPGGSADSMMRPGGLPSPGMEMLQRQLLLEREQSIRAAAHGAAQASFFAQQEEMIRYEQERARHAAAVQAASRPP